MWPPHGISNEYTLTTHHAMFAVDIHQFGIRDRATHLHLRAALYRIVHDACAAVGLAWRDLHHEDRGDGILLVLPSQISVELPLGPIAALMHADVRRHNRMASSTARLRVRTAVHAGYLQFDSFGVAGRAVVHLDRLLNAPTFKATLEEHGAELGLITSHHVHEEVIQQEPTLVDPAAFDRIEVENKETTTVAWLWLPRALPSELSRADWRRRVNGRRSG